MWEIDAGNQTIAAQRLPDKQHLCRRSVGVLLKGSSGSQCRSCLRKDLTIIIRCGINVAVKLRWSSHVPAPLVWGDDSYWQRR
jgi:hypothetical protein